MDDQAARTSEGARPPAKRVAVIPGDGVGNDVVAEGLKVVEVYNRLGLANIATEVFPWSCEYYLKTGHMMPEDGVETLKAFDAIYLGAIGYPTVPDHISLWELILPIRQKLAQYINLRPAKLLKGFPTPLKDRGPEDIDIMFVRENSEGEYAGIGGLLHGPTSDQVAVQVAVFTREASLRVLRYSFELAMTRRRNLVAITKSNALNYSMVFWDRLVEEVAAGYPDVQWRTMHVDAAAAGLVSRPNQFDVVVGSNLFADILTDLGGVIQGGLGTAASANLNPEGTYPSMFEPVHGSAPKYAGTGVANPVGAIWSIQLMLEHLGLGEAARVIVPSIEEVCGTRGIRTRDLGGGATTSDVGTAVAEEVERRLAG